MSGIETGNPQLRASETRPSVEDLQVPVEQGASVERREVVPPGDVVRKIETQGGSEGVPTPKFDSPEEKDRFYNGTTTNSLTKHPKLVIDSKTDYSNSNTWILGLEDKAAGHGPR